MAKTSSKNAEQALDFEAAMGELENLVEKLEQGEYTLEESIKQFERGIELTRRCQHALRAAEQKVMRLVKDGDAETLQDFDLPEED
ncbi:MAG: exodeoxyribonuclease VII small subunit [Gammaproteobacteria bacterium]